MIVKEIVGIRSDGKILTRTYSDADFKIVQIETNIVYDEAIDVEDVNYTYEETDIKIIL